MTTSKNIQEFLVSLGSDSTIRSETRNAVQELMKNNEFKFRLAAQAMMMQKIMRAANLIEQIERIDKILSSDGGLRIEMMNDKNLVSLMREYNQEINDTIKILCSGSPGVEEIPKASDNVTNIMVNINDETRKIFNQEEEIKRTQVRDTVRSLINDLVSKVKKAHANERKEFDEPR